jgi:hypothetical protein
MLTLRPMALAALAFVLAVVACGRGKAQTPEGQAKDQALAGLGSAALPAETRVVIGVAVPKLAASPLARRLVGELLGRDPEARDRLSALLTRCKIDPLRDVDGVTIGLAVGQDVALLVRGRLDDAALVECVRAEALAAGGSFADEAVAGRTVHGVTSKQGAQRVWFVSEPDHTVIVSLSLPFLTKVLDPKTPKVDSVPETAALLGRVSPTAALWGAGFLPSGVGQNLVKLTDGKVAEPAHSVAFEASFDAGLAALLRLDMKTSADADHLATFAKGQLDWLAIAAQRYALGPLVAQKLSITTEQASVKLSLRLDEADVKNLEAALAKGAPAATPNEKNEKKE